MSLNHHKLNRQPAFSLLEISIFLLILSILSTTQISFFNNVTNKKKEDKTEEKLDRIQNALLAFFIANSRLPCPASPIQVKNNSTYGQEKITLNTNLPASCNTNNTGILSANLNADKLYYGAVPAKSLGLELEDMLDSYNNKISYIVQQTFINNSTTNASCINGFNAQDKALNMPADKGYFCFAGQASGGVDISLQSLDIEIYDTYNGSKITPNAVYILISHGENGYGAFTAAANANIDNGSSVSSNPIRNSMPPISHTDELENLDCNPTTGLCGPLSLNQQYVAGRKSNVFDDYVRYMDRNDMLKICNEFTNNECTIQYKIYVK